MSTVVIGAMGLGLWVASLAAPLAVIPKGQFLGLRSAPELVVRGWDFLRDSVLAIPGLWHDPGDIFPILLALGSASVVVSPFAMLSRRRSVRLAVGIVASVEALALLTVYVFNQGWQWSGYGFWLWLCSFILVGTMLLFARQPSGEGIEFKRAG